MKYLMFFLFSCVNLFSQNFETKGSFNASNIEAGSFVSFNPYKKITSPGIFAGYWYVYPKDETDTQLEIGGDIYYSSSFYSLSYGKNDQFYDVLSNEYFFNIGGRMVKKITSGKYDFFWVSELAFHTLFLDGRNIPDDEIRTEDDDANSIFIDAVSITSLKISQGLRIWRNHLGFSISASYVPYGLWYKNTVPQNFHTYSVETGINLRF